MSEEVNARERKDMCWAKRRRWLRRLWGEISRRLVGGIDTRGKLPGFREATMIRLYNTSIEFARGISTQSPHNTLSAHPPTSCPWPAQYPPVSVGSARPASSP